MSFDVAQALTTVQLSRIAYRLRDESEQDTIALGLGGYRDFSGPSTQALIVDDATTRYLAFRGTESNNHVDWMRDAEFRPVPGVFGTSVHSGFRRALDEIWFDLLAQLPVANRGLVITGHSLGGGLATLAAARLVDVGHTVNAVYTYGSPRSGLKDFTDAYQEALGTNTFRVINHIDIVTRVPFLVQRYRHVGRRMYFDGNGQFHPDAGAWHIARDDLVARLKHFGTIRSAGVGPHEISRYVKRIREIQ